MKHTECKIDTPNEHIHDRLLSCLGTGTAIKSGGFNLDLRTLRENTLCRLLIFSFTSDQYIIY